MAVGVTASQDQAARIANLEAEAVPTPPTILSGSADAIPIKQGLVVVTSAGVDAMTLVAPTAGPQIAGGDDGKILRVSSTTAQAHTITTPTNGIFPTKHIVTFAAAVGSFIELVASGGQWYTMAGTGATIT